MSKRAFSLIELLVATALSAVLMAAVLAILSGIARDRRRLTAVESVPRSQAMVDRIQWDLTNAQSLSPSPDGQSLELIGHGGIDNKTLAPNGRLASVSYLIYPDGVTSYLVREQKYLDDPVAPNPWRELIAVGITDFQVIAQSTEEIVPGPTEQKSGVILASSLRPKGPVLRVHERVRLRVTSAAGVVDRDLWVR